MRLVIFPILLLVCGTITVCAYEDQMLEDDDFAEFEQFDVDDEATVAGNLDFGDEVKEEPVQKAKSVLKEQFDTNGVEEPEDDIMVEDEDSEFEHFQDPEEFEGFQDSVPRTSEQPKITINKVPIMLRPRWDAYWLEGILCCLLAAYALAFVLGRGKNTAIAVDFLKQHAPLLKENFTLVGETGADVVADDGSGRGWRREAEHCFSMWCSGRVCCEGMLLTLQLIKRQDLAHVLFNVVRPSPDTLLIRAELGKDEGDPFVLCVAQKKVANKLVKEMQDLSVYCPERRAGDRHGLPSSLSVMSECAEAAAALLDARVTAAVARLPRFISLHVSDQYALRPREETTGTKPPETERVLVLKMSLEGDASEARQLLQLAFYLVDKVKRMRLSKEALAKCEKRRQKVLEAWERGAHAARQEQAAQRREERRKVEKERILAEDDPEKQRRWELKEQKRQQKRKTPKMKQLKVKAL